MSDKNLARRTKAEISFAGVNGWYEVNVVGSHHQFKHPTKKGRTTVKHPDKDIPLVYVCHTN